MANRIGVLEPDANPQADNPLRHVKRVVAQSLVRKALAVWVSQYVIQLLTIRAAAQSDPDRFMQWQYAGLVPKIGPPRGPENLILTYPLADQRSVV